MDLTEGQDTLKMPTPNKSERKKVNLTNKHLFNAIIPAPYL